MESRPLTSHATKNRTPPSIVVALGGAPANRFICDGGKAMVAAHIVIAPSKPKPNEPDPALVASSPLASTEREFLATPLPFAHPATSFEPSGWMEIARWQTFTTYDQRRPTAKKSR